MITEPIRQVSGRRRFPPWLLASLLIIVVALVTAAIALQPWKPAIWHGGLRIADPPAPIRAHNTLVPVGATVPPPTSAGVTQTVDKAVHSPDLGTFSGVITDAQTGTTLWQSGAQQTMIPSSTAKVLTSAAALLALPADQRLETTVVAGAHPGQIVLVAGGDPTLTVQPDGKGYYPNGPRLSQLADQVRAAGVPVSSILVDDSVFSGPTMAEGWDPADIRDGSITPIEPVMLDGGRVKPLDEYSPRSTTPSLDTGRALARALGVDPAQVRLGNAPPGEKKLASVFSAPLRDRLRDLMVHSDNVLAETVGREIAVKLGEPASFTGAAEAVVTTLTGAGFPTTGVTTRDTSGLSVNDRIPPQLLDTILATAARNPPAASAHQTSAVPTGTNTGKDNPKRAATLAPMLDYLPVAGGTGSLATRFVDRNTAGAGWVRAKTGTLSVASALVGYVLDNDGRILTFALMSNGRPPEASRPALDTVAATLRGCGCT